MSSYECFVSMSIEYNPNYNTFLSAMPFGGGTGNAFGVMGSWGNLTLVWACRSLRSNSAISIAVRVRVRLCVGANEEISMHTPSRRSLGAILWVTGKKWTTYSLCKKWTSIIRGFSDAYTPRSILIVHVHRPCTATCCLQLQFAKDTCTGNTPRSRDLLSFRESLSA